MSVVQGRILEVWIEPTGDVLITAAITSDTVLYLNDVSDFSDSGGQLMINGVVKTYLSRDTSLDSLTLSGTLGAAAADGDPVYISPLSYEKWCHVKPDEGMDMLKVRIPRSIDSRFDTEIRTEVDKESVLISDETGEWVIKDVIGGNSNFIALYTGEANEIEPASILADVDLTTASLKLFSPKIHETRLRPEIWLEQLGVGPVDSQLTLFNVKSANFIGSSLRFGVGQSNTGLKGIGFGWQDFLVTDASSLITLGHGLGKIPEFAHVWPDAGNSGMTCYVKKNSLTSTDLVAEVHNSNTGVNVGPGVSVDVYWFAIALG